MRRPALILLTTALAAPALALAHDEVPPAINTGSELFEWCRAESEAEFVAQGRTPYNFSGRHLERGNTLVVEATWRVDGVRHEILCQAARGARRENATLRIVPAE